MGVVTLLVQPDEQIERLVAGSVKHGALMVLKENGLQELVPRYGTMVERAAEIIWRQQAIPLDPDGCLSLNDNSCGPGAAIYCSATAISYALEELVGRVGAVQRSLLFMDVGLEQGSHQL